MDARPTVDPVLNTIPLLNAVLCADCEIITESAGDVCLVCGSHSLLSLGRILGGSVGEDRAVVLPEEGDEARRLLPVLLKREAS